MTYGEVDLAKMFDNMNVEILVRRGDGGWLCSVKALDPAAVGYVHVTIGADTFEESVVNALSVFNRLRCGAV